MGYGERFDKFIPFVLEAECVFREGHYGDYTQVITEHFKGDNGGDTYADIDRESHPRFDFADPTKVNAKDVYWQEWQGNGIEGMAYPTGGGFLGHWGKRGVWAGAEDFGENWGRRGQVP
jgi:hypothetical protein